jgi:hypothetical protein
MIRSFSPLLLILILSLGAASEVRGACGDTANLRFPYDRYANLQHHLFSN